MAYKNAKVTPAHVRLVVRKVWRLYERLQVLARFESQIPYFMEGNELYERYLDQRKLAERAIAALPEEQRKEFELP